MKSLVVTNPHLQTVRDVLNQVRVRQDTGLSIQEVQRRRKLLGLNKIPSDKRNRILLIFLERFRDALVIILLLAAAVSFLLGRIGDAAIIGIAIAIDVLLSFIQVWRTEKTLQKMRKRMEDEVTVLRDGSLQSISSTGLVVGDIIELRTGEKVPADARLIRAQGLRVQESILTGESGDAKKATAKLSTRSSVGSRTNMVFSGTTVASGAGSAVVTAIGTQTEFGKIAQVLRDQKSPESPLRRKLQKKGLQIGAAIIIATVILSILGLLRGQDFFDTAYTAITLVVSAIPEDLTMTLTIVLTVGVARVLKKGGAVRKLSSGETLGAATVICTDKTGTLTEGSMKAIQLNFLQGYELQPYSTPSDPYHILAVTSLVLANDSRPVRQGSHEYIGSATEKASLAFAENLGVQKSSAEKQWKLRDSIPFSSKWKYRAILADHPTQPSQTIFVTGAPDVLLERSSETLSSQNTPISLTSKQRFTIQQKIDHISSQGKRLIAIAVRRNRSQHEITHDDISGLLFLGVLIIEDPVRADISQSITEARSAGVAIKLVTGDYGATAKAVARKVGLSSTVESEYTGEEMQEMPDAELTGHIEHGTIFSRVEPLDKQRIVRLLQQRGHIVAMTGDGVNDTVALKSADIGVAMGSGTDIAKDASDLVLLNNSFSTIVSAIKEGRVIRDNVKKVMAFLLATNAAEVLIFFVSIAAGLPLPLLPAQILWINLVTDGTSDIALSLEPAEKNVMKRGPEEPSKPILGKRILADIIFSGLIMTTGTMLLFWYMLEYAGQSLPYARTMAFTFLAVSSLLSVWSFRSLTTPAYRQRIWENKWVFVSAGFSLALHAASLYIPAMSNFFNTTPLNIQDWAIIATLSIIAVVLIDTRKLVLPPWFAQHQKSALLAKQ